MEKKEFFTGNAEEMESHNKVPMGFALFFIGMIIWGVFYLWAYTPELGGWSQHQELVEEIKK